jgi:glycosyltransferase involved in cell wall biosynthesis
MSPSHLVRDVRRRWRLYRLQHAVARWRDGLARPPSGAAYDVCYVVAPQNRGWILDRVARELAAANPHRRVIVSESGALPDARTYFFTHANLFLREMGWRGRAGRTRAVFVTHAFPDHLDEVASGLRGAHLVVCMNSSVRDALLERGVPLARTQVAIGGVDADQFTPGPRPRPRRVLLSSGFYDRKAPDALLALVRALPAEPFLLVGRGWKRWSGFEALSSCANFEYVETGYEEYPAHYRRCDLFVSLSSLEGGPIPLLEAMHADLVPVVSRTGFAPDVIEHGRNGFLFDPGVPIDVIAALLEAARARPFDVRSSAAEYTWAAFCSRVNSALDRLLEPGPPPPAS